MIHPLDKFEYCPVCGSHHFAYNSNKSKLCDHCGFEYFINPCSANVAFILNEKKELLVVKRKKEPAKGMLDLPGGFNDIGETGEQAVTREVKEETNLDVTKATYIFSYPNIYRYSGIDIPTMDMFFLCEVSDTKNVQVADDAAAYQWIALDKIKTEQFGLRSVRQGLYDFIERYGK